MEPRPKKQLIDYCVAATQFGINKTALSIFPFGASMICGVAQLKVLLAYCGRLVGANLIALIA